MKRSRGWCASTVVGLILLLGASGARAERPLPLKVPGFRTAALVPARGAGAWPVAIALHGNFDRPEWICEEMAKLVRGRAWLLCPRGIPRPDAPREHDRWTYPGRPRVMAEIEAALAALKEQHPGRVREGALTLLGFSLGAIYGARFAVAQPERFPRLYLVEGSQQVWTAKNLAHFAAKGGKAVLFGCGRKGCGVRSRELCRQLQKKEVGCGEVTEPGLGHSYGDPLPQKATPLFEELIAADPSWDQKGAADEEPRSR